MLTAGEDEKESVVLSTNSQKSGQWSVKQVVALAEASNGAAQSSRVHHGQRRYLDTIASWVLASASANASLKTDHPRYGGYSQGQAPLGVAGSSHGVQHVYYLNLRLPSYVKAG